MSSSIICSGNSNKEFRFIVKNNDTYTYRTAGTVENNIPLSSIEGHPNATFEGLCAYASETDSMYLSFKSTVNTTEQVYDTTVSTIYHLGSNKLSETSIRLQNTTLFSFLPIRGYNNTSHLAYIVSDNNQYRLNLTDFHLGDSTSREISGPGVLAVGGGGSQNLFLIQANSIDEYRLGELDFAQTTFKTQLRINRGTVGKVLSFNNIDYISVYDPEREELDLLVHNVAGTKYENISMSNGHPDLSVSTPAQSYNGTIPAVNITSAVSHQTFREATTTKPASATSKDNSKKSTATTTSTESDTRPTEVKNDKEGKIFSKEKRGLLDVGSDSQSLDGSYVYKRMNVSSNDNSPISIVALISSEASSESQPYEIYYVSGNDTAGYNVQMLDTSPGSVESEEPVGNLSGGAIAGIVIGILIFIALVTGLLYYTKRSKRAKNTTSRSYNSMPLSIQPDILETPYLGAINHSKTSSILQETKNVPDEYRDLNRPDIRPLSYINDKVDYAELSDDELLLLEPDVQGPLFLFSGVYTSHEEEKVTYLKEGYAIRTFDADDGHKHTIHYFSSANLDTFTRSVFGIIRCSSSTEENYVMKSERAIVLCKPTPEFSYQYIWITSPMIPENSLYYLLFERTSWTFVDHHNADYKIWSIYSILKSIETLHSHKIIHSAIDLKAFYYDHETKATDWRLGNFGYAQSSSNPVALQSPYTSFTAPEIVYYNKGGSELSDLWSAGCVIYTVATGGLLLFDDATQVKNLVTFNDDMKQHLKVQIRDQVENHVFKTILDDLLKVDPFQRKGISEIMDYWNGIYNMDE
ncbi:uncharacterized protein EV154DRAFT_453671 [Mucor mucedo]|uniref:uncharacterized protein n=1 Tax=Mucor mucedo TaxID=29922 RepID=UPI002220A66D|nr:uncharacterized protein EV154DRAFT_453671 [Mucor mucedo]KAI7868045.1 hypothetical protein EV154DRAFT_453671 [Mucor mucedo]